MKVLALNMYNENKSIISDVECLNDGMTGLLTGLSIDGAYPQSYIITGGKIKSGLDCYDFDKFIKEVELGLPYFRFKLPVIGVLDLKFSNTPILVLRVPEELKVYSVFPYVFLRNFQVVLDYNENIHYTKLFEKTNENI